MPSIRPDLACRFVDRGIVVVTRVSELGANRANYAAYYATDTYCNSQLQRPKNQIIYTRA